MSSGGSDPDALQSQMTPFPLNFSRLNDYLGGKTSPGSAKTVTILGQTMKDYKLKICTTLLKKYSMVQEVLC